jgi:DNA modification methylase
MERVDIRQIRPNPDNPRFIKGGKFEKLVKSIKEFPEMLELRPIVVNQDMVVLGGNMRLQACEEAGIEQVPVIFADNLTEEQQKEFIIKDNSSFGEWDWDLLANEWETQDLIEWGLDIPDDWAADEVLQAKEDDFEESADAIETDIVLGDVITIGKHTLICGSATSGSDWEKLNIQEDTISFTSPPYNAGDSSKLTGNKSASKRGNFYEGYKDDSGDYLELLQESLSNALAYTQGVCFNVQMLANNKTLVIDWIHQNKDALVDMLIWDKGHSAPAMASGVCSSTFEWLAVFNLHNNSRTIPLSSWRGTISNVYSAPPQRSNEFSQHHAATFPMHLPEFIVGKLMDKSKGVVDCFMGTGTTMVAAHQLNKIAYGIELDPKYCQLTIDRMKKLDPTLEVKINGTIYDK